MSSVEIPEPVVVTYRMVEAVFSRPEAVEAVVDQANSDPESTDIERATAAATMGHVLNQLRRSEEAVEALVLNSPHSGTATRIQSMIAEKAVKFEPLPAGGLEAKFDTSDWIGWASVAWQKIRHLKRHAIQRPRTTLPESIPEKARIGLVGDWGSGLYGARPIANSIIAGEAFDMLVHLGDVYYSGTIKEVEDRFLALWPATKAKVNRALNSNHEMYAGGYAYFDHTLPKFNQEASYFTSANTHWVVIGLDLAYKDHDIDPVQLTWLEEVMSRVGTRKVILLSHHQLFSHFESQGVDLMAQERFTRILKDPRVVAWYCGHEHRCTIFEQKHSVYDLYGRCIGHGGMPQSRSKTRNLPQATDPIYSRDLWVRSSGQNKNLPDCVVLEGPNQYIVGEQNKFTPHGYAVLLLDGHNLIEQVLTASGQVIYEKHLVT